MLERLLGVADGPVPVEEPLVGLGVPVCSADRDDRPGHLGINRGGFGHPLLVGAPGPLHDVGEVGEPAQRVDHPTAEAANQVGLSGGGRPSQLIGQGGEEAGHPPFVTRPGLGSDQMVPDGGHGAQQGAPHRLLLLVSEGRGQAHESGHSGPARLDEGPGIVHQHEPLHRIQQVEPVHERNQQRFLVSRSVEAVPAGVGDHPIHRSVQGDRDPRPFHQHAGLERVSARHPS